MDLMDEDCDCSVFYVVAEDLAPDKVAVQSRGRCFGVSAGTTVGRVVGCVKVLGLRQKPSPAWVDIPTKVMETKFEKGGEIYFKVLQDDDPRARRQKLDKSKDWALSVLTPFSHENIGQSENLKDAMAEPLPLKIPISTELYEKLDLETAKHFVSNDVYKAEQISSHINIFMRQGVGVGSESFQQSNWDVIFLNFWSLLLDLTQIDMINFDRNLTDPSGASTAGVRPDLLLWSVRRLVAKFEEKKNTLPGAYEDLRNKLCVLPVHFYGPVDWVIGVG